MNSAACCWPATTPLRFLILLEFQGPGSKSTGSGTKCTAVGIE